MTDHELLENAAKAAGLTIDAFCMDGGAWVYVTWSPLNGDGEHPIFKWNPLANDGDALRLAVTLSISVSYDRLDQGVDERRVFAVHARGVELEHLGEDRYAATRLAITRAAAAIGKAMP